MSAVITECPQCALGMPGHEDPHAEPKKRDIRKLLLRSYGLAIAVLFIGGFATLGIRPGIGVLMLMGGQMLLAAGG